MELKSLVQLEKAKLEDTLIDILYHKYKDLVFHGGTCIWRCYGGNRFSRDIDFYLKADTDDERMRSYHETSEFLKEYKFAMKEKGYNRSNNTMHFLVESNVKMKVDINFNYKKGEPVEYTRVDGSKITVLSLLPLQLLNEKIDAYTDKLENAGRFKQPEAQDLYDMYQLVQLVSKHDKATAKRLLHLMARIENEPPADMASLGSVIISGVPPSLELMLKRIREWSNACD